MIGWEEGLTDGGFQPSFHFISLSLSVLILKTGSNKYHWYYTVAMTIKGDNLCTWMLIPIKRRPSEAQNCRKKLSSPAAIHPGVRGCIRQHCSSQNQSKLQCKRYTGAPLMVSNETTQKSASCNSFPPTCGVLSGFSFMYINIIYCTSVSPGYKFHVRLH